MIQRFLLLCCFIVPQLIPAQTDKVHVFFDSTSQKYTYTKVVEVPGKTAAELYTATRKWCIDKFLDDKFLNEEANEKLVDLGNFQVNMTYNAAGMKLPQSYTILYSITTLFKEGKCRIEISNIKRSLNSNGYSVEQPIESYKKDMDNMKGIGKKKAQKMMEDTFVEIDTKVKQVIAELEKALKGETPAKKDW